MNFKHKATLAVTMAALLGAAGTAHAEFQGRDATGAASSTCTATGPNKCTYFYYTTLNITILNNWSIGQGFWDEGASVGSAQELATSAGLAASGLSGWVLPTGARIGGSGPNQYLGIWTSVGSSFAGLSSQFDGVMPSSYWSSSFFDLNPTLGAWSFRPDLGNTFLVETGFPLYAVAVRPGDIAAVPEPHTYALMLMGVGALLLAKRRRRH